MEKPQLHFIGGEKGGVGKSVVARLLAQYWIDRGVGWRGFDTDRSHGALLRYYTDYSKPLEVSRVEQLDNIIETAIETQCNVLIDLAAQTEDTLHTWISDSDLLAMAEELGLDIYLWYVVDDGKDSINLLNRFLSRYGRNARNVVVLNHGRGDNFQPLKSSPAGEKIQEHDIPIIELKSLHKATMQKIDQNDKSFWAAVNNTDPELGECLSIMERQRVRIWLQRIHQDFERIAG